MLNLLFEVQVPSMWKRTCSPGDINYSKMVEISRIILQSCRWRDWAIWLHIGCYAWELVFWCCHTSPISEELFLCWNKIFLKDRNVQNIFVKTTQNKLSNLVQVYLMRTESDVLSDIGTFPPNCACPSLKINILKRERKFRIKSITTLVKGLINWVKIWLRYVLFECFGMR